MVATKTARPGLSDSPQDVLELPPTNARFGEMSGPSVFTNRRFDVPVQPGHRFETDRLATIKWASKHGIAPRRFEVPEIVAGTGCFSQTSKNSVSDTSTTYSDGDRTQDHQMDYEQDAIGDD